MCPRSACRTDEQVDRMGLDCHHSCASTLTPTPRTNRVYRCSITRVHTTLCDTIRRLLFYLDYQCQRAVDPESLHADVVGSTMLVQQDEQKAHARIQDSCRLFGETISKYHGLVCELRGDALLTEFERASDAISAALSFQSDQENYNAQLDEDICLAIRIGIAMGEVVNADDTITGAGVVLAQRHEQLAEPGGTMCNAGDPRSATAAPPPARSARIW